MARLFTVPDGKPRSARRPRGACSASRESLPSALVLGGVEDAIGGALGGDGWGTQVLQLAALAGRFTASIRA